MTEQTTLTATPDRPPHPMASRRWWTTTTWVVRLWRSWRTELWGGGLTGRRRTLNQVSRAPAPGWTLPTSFRRSLQLILEGEPPLRHTRPVEGPRRSAVGLGTWSRWGGCVRLEHPPAHRGRGAPVEVHDPVEEEAPNL